MDDLMDKLSAILPENPNAELVNMFEKALGDPTLKIDLESSVKKLPEGSRKFLEQVVFNEEVSDEKLAKALKISLGELETIRLKLEEMLRELITA